MNGSEYALKSKVNQVTNSKSSKNILQQWLMPLTFVISDVSALFVSWALSFIIANALGKTLRFDNYAHLLAFIPLFILAFSLMNLYSRTSINPVEELRRQVLITSFSFFFIVTMTFILHRESLFLYSRFAILLAGSFSLFAIPIFRCLTRNYFGKKKWWGTPVLILGAGKTGQMIARRITNNPSSGLKVIGLLDDDLEKHSNHLNFPASGTISDMRNIAINTKACKVLVCMPGVEKETLLSIIGECSQYFNHVTIIPNLFGISSLWVSAKDLGGILALDIKNATLSRSAQIIKRIMDVLLTLIGGFLILPIILIASFLIKVDSPGNIFYGNKRVGKNRDPFLCWKFRSMRQNADEVLNTYLSKDPKLKQEWENNQKLQDDPRITKIGKIIRKWSIDELPQLWNVLKGEMSLVGPRPCFEEQLQMYGKNKDLYIRVKPGITGLWQISGRNNLSFDDRVKLERYYVSNWSIWLDIYILGKTIMVVLKGEGAY